MKIDWTALREYSIPIAAVGAAVFTGLQLLRLWLQSRHRFELVTSDTVSLDLTRPNWVVFKVQLEVSYRGPGTVLFPKATWIPDRKNLRKDYTIIPEDPNCRMYDLNSRHARTEQRLSKTDAVRLKVFLPIEAWKFESLRDQTIPGRLFFQYGPKKFFRLAYSLEFSAPATISS